MNLPLFAAFWLRLWHSGFVFAVPLVIALSLVYAATRHEEMKDILRHALRMGITITVFMAVIFVILWYFSQGL
ncbi:MAG: hypothetical protein JXB10_10815 [Pirellulales bacterium]|nr:hypothetical protein [Pirellulales bacterium]